MDDMDTRRLLLLCLYTVKCGAGNRGICAQVWKAYDLLPIEVAREHCQKMDTLLPELFRSWPMFSGDAGYPVPSPFGGAAAAAYYGCGNNFWSGDYGRDRKDLLEHCIKQLRNDDSPFVD